MTKKENIGDIFSDASARLAEQFRLIGAEAAENIHVVIKENTKFIDEWKESNKIPADAVAAYNRGVEDAAKMIEFLGENNVGMIHETNRLEAARIRGLKK